MNPEMNPSNGPSSGIDVTTVIRLMMEQISTFGQTVGQLQSQVNELNTRLSTDPMPTDPTPRHEVDRKLTVETIRDWQRVK